MGQIHWGNSIALHSFVGKWGFPIRLIMINFSTDDVGSADWLYILFLELWGYSIEVRNAQSNDSSTTHYKSVMIATQ